MSDAYICLGRHTEALADFEEALELTRGTGIKEGELCSWAFNALTRARLGDLSALALLGN